MYELFNFRSIHWWNSVFSCPLLYFSQIARTPVSTSIRHRSDVKVSARCVIDVNPFFLLSGCCYMSVMTYLNIVNSNAYSTVRSGWQESKDQTFRLMALCKGNPQVTSRFLWQKRPVMWKPFPCHDIYTNWSRSSTFMVCTLYPCQEMDAWELPTCRQITCYIQVGYYRLSIAYAIVPLNWPMSICIVYTSYVTRCRVHLNGLDY